MSDEFKIQPAELPKEAQIVVDKTIANVNAKEKGYIVEADAISGKGFMLFLMICLMAATVHVAHGVIRQDKELFSNNGKLAFSSQQQLSEVELVTMNQMKLEKSLKDMKEAVRQRSALNKIQAHLMASKQDNRVLSDDEARKLLLRAGYMPSEIDEKKINKVKNRHQDIATGHENKVDQDVDFAKHVASDIVRDEVESFAHKMRLLSTVGGYVFDRVTAE